MPDQTIAEKAKGLAKEAVGKLSGDERRTREGEAQQAKAQKRDEAEEAELQAQQKRQQAAGHKGEEARHQE